MDAQMQPSSQDVTTSMWRYGMSLWRALDRERLEFFDPFRIAAQIGFRAARHHPPSAETSWHLMQYNAGLLNRAWLANQEQLTSYALEEGAKGWNAWFNTLLGTPGETIEQFAERQADVMDAVANFNRQIERVRDDFGFQFRSADYKLVHETSCFLMYQVVPLDKSVKVRRDLKPMLLVPPYMLGVHILAFLPHEKKSYAHAFADAGIPTYVRVVKDIWENEKVQTMTPEDDCLQTRELCAVLMEKHGQKVTLNGTCQGGYISLMNILSGRLRNVCDTLISNVTPVDGTFSAAISNVPRMGHDFVLSQLPNGNFVANGYLLSLGMRLTALDHETPLVQVLNQARLEERGGLAQSRSTAALFRWLRKERVHLPPAIAEMSSITFEQPVAADGTLPVRLFGQPLMIGDLAALNIRWYQDYAVKDDLVTPACATAGNRLVEASGLLESVPFPGGHVAILTSPYNPKAPVNGRFVAPNGCVSRGPVLFQLEIGERPKLNGPA
ncbi:MAG: metal transporter [Rhodospirillales bacterium]|nr:metal transporter [Rhodospirillales bacterium]